MKKIILLVSIFIGFALTANAQKRIKGNGNVTTETRQTSNYDVIKVFGSPDVIIVDGNEGELTVITDENLVPYVITEVKNNELIIKLKDNFNYSTRKGIKIEVPVQDISSITLSGSGDIISNKKLTDKNLNIELKGSGDIKLNVDSQNIEANVFGSGDLEIEGKTNTLNAKVKGSGDLNAENLKAEVANLSVNGSGDIKAYVSTEVNASIIGSGDITVEGSPKQISKSVKGSGDIEIN